MKKQKRTHRRLWAVLTGIAAALAMLYLLFVYSNIPFIRFWRGIYIETAMTTADHQWLAEWFIPASVIEKQMSGKVEDGAVGGEAYLETKGEEPAGSEKIPETEPEQAEQGLDLSVPVGEEDMAGNTVIVSDTEEGVLISEVSGEGYKGLVMLVDDPSRVALIDTVKENGEGTRMPYILQDPRIVAGINASGFHDPGGEGNGGTVLGLSYDGKTVKGSYMNGHASILITRSDRLVVGSFSDWEKYDIRGGMQFGPVLVADGDGVMTGSSGYGIHPRTAIGQRADGVMIFVVIDGRDVLHSIGCTVGELTKIFLAYGAENAACCDGGSSSVLGYDGKVMNKNSSLNPEYGRRLPNAFVVYSKKS